MVTGRRREPLEAVADEARKAGGSALAVTADIAHPASVASLFDAVTAKFGRLDLLFNNAGIFPPAVPIDDLPVERWKAAPSISI